MRSETGGLYSKCTNVDMWLKFIWEFKKKKRGGILKAVISFLHLHVSQSVLSPYVGSLVCKIGLIFRITPTHFLQVRKTWLWWPYRSRTKALSYFCHCILINQKPPHHPPLPFPPKQGCYISRPSINSLFPTHVGEDGGLAFLSVPFPREPWKIHPFNTSFSVCLELVFPIEVLERGIVFNLNLSRGRLCWLPLSCSTGPDGDLLKGTSVE